ncbi:MAG TPA: peptidylprolyl isomerase [Clostridiales bacterium]|nr:peptidylprolyl isomerase [Clostridiales bacterium]
MKKPTAVILLLFLAFFLTACGGAHVAEVNGEGITVAEFDEYWDNLRVIYEANDETLEDSAEMKETVVNQLVYYRLLKQTAITKDCWPTEEETQTYFEEQLAALYGTYGEGLEEIETYHLDQDFFFNQYRYMLAEENIKDSLAAEEDLTVSMDAAQEIYDADPVSYNTRVVSHILIKPYAADDREVKTDEEGDLLYTDQEWQTAKERAEKIIKQLDDGASFVTMAVKYSDDTATAATGGKIDLTLTEDNTELEASFVAAAFSLEEAGTYTKTPVKTSYGYHIIYCDESLSPAHIDEVLAFICAEQENTEKQSLLTTYMEAQKQAADIAYHYDLVK